MRLRGDDPYCHVDATGKEQPDMQAAENTPDTPLSARRMLFSRTTASRISGGSLAASAATRCTMLASCSSSLLHLCVNRDAATPARLAHARHLPNGRLDGDRRARFHPRHDGPRVLAG